MHLTVDRNKNILVICYDKKTVFIHRDIGNLEDFYTRNVNFRLLWFQTKRRLEGVRAGSVVGKECWP